MKMHWTSWKDYTQEMFMDKPAKPKPKPKKLSTKTARVKSKIVGKPCEQHEAKERWKHVNERRY